MPKVEVDMDEQARRKAEAEAAAALQASREKVARNGLLGSLPADATIGETVDAALIHQDSSGQRLGARAAGKRLIAEHPGTVSAAETDAQLRDIYGENGGQCSIFAHLLRNLR